MKTIEEIVEGQFQAFNAADIDAFMSYWWEDAKFYEYPFKLVADGASEIRDLVSRSFKFRNVHCTLISRSFLSDRVIEHVTLTENGFLGPMVSNIVAIYKVEGQKIRTASFMITPAPGSSAMLA